MFHMYLIIWIYLISWWHHFSDNKPAYKDGWNTEHCSVTGCVIQIDLEKGVNKKDEKKNYVLLTVVYNFSFKHTINMDFLDIWFEQDIIGRKRCLILCRSVEQFWCCWRWFYTVWMNLVTIQIWPVFVKWLPAYCKYKYKYKYKYKFGQRLSSDCLPSALLLLLFFHPALGILICRWWRWWWRWW